MPVRIQTITKGHQPGDLASFSDAETESLIRSGAGRVEDPQNDVESALFELQKTLPPVRPGRVPEIVAPTRLAEPTLTEAAAPAAPTAASSAPVKDPPPAKPPVLAAPAKEAK